MAWIKNKFSLSISLISIYSLLTNQVSLCSAAATNEPSSLNGLDSSTGQKPPSQDVFSTRSLAKDCDASYSLSCFKLDVLSFVEKMQESSDYSILPGLSIVKETTGNEAKTADVVAQLARSFPNDPSKRLDNFLLYKLNNYLNTHALRLKLIDNGKGDLGEARKGGGSGFGGSGFGGGGGKKGGGGGGLLAAAMMMKGTLAALGLGAIAMLAGKALMTALMALMLSAIIGLKSLSHGGHKSTTYEIVTKPVYSHSNTHSSSHEDVHSHGYGHSGYGRSMNLELTNNPQPPEPYQNQYS